MIFILLSLFFTWGENKDYIFTRQIEKELQQYEHLINKVELLNPGLLKKEINFKIAQYNRKKSSHFKIKKGFKEATSFWYLVYSEISQEQVVIHDKVFPSLIYVLLDFRRLKKFIPDPFVRVKVQNYFASIFVEEIKTYLKKNDIKNKKFKSIIKESIQDFAGRSKTFKPSARIEELRTQTGQREHVSQAFKRLKSFYPPLSSLAQKFKLPPEILMLSILESRFNPKAISQVNARGLWQIMPYIGDIVFPSRETFYEFNLPIASLSAFEILRQNIRIFKDWELALTAYNAGIKNVRDELKKLSPKNRNLLTLKEATSENSLGYAAFNFYAEFLALQLAATDTLKKAKNNGIFYYYLTNCKFNPQAFFAKFKDPESIKNLNQNFNIHKVYPRGTLISTQQKLTPKRYTRIPPSVYIHKRPIEFKKIVKVGKCL